LRTISYQNLLAKYTALRGVDELLDQEKSDFSNSLNHRIKQIWVKSRWPDLTVIVEKTLQAIDTPSLKVENGVRIDNIDDLFEVYSVFEKNPYEDHTAVRLPFYLLDGHLVVSQSIKATSIFVVGSKVPHDDYGNGYFSGAGREDIPAFMEWALLAYAMHDYYLADGQADKALVQLQKAEEHILEAIERFERLESQNRVTVNVYPPSNFGSYLLAQRNL
jgi:hypothetical protein